MEFNQDLTFNENDTERLIAACLLGNISAKKMLLNNYLSFADMVVHRYISNKQLAEELRNDGLMKMLASLATYNPEKGSFDDWFKSILKRIALDALKKNNKHFRNMPFPLLTQLNQKKQGVQKPERRLPQN